MIVGIIATTVILSGNILFHDFLTVIIVTILMNIAFMITIILDFCCGYCS